MKKTIKLVYKLLHIKIPTYFNCLLSGLRYNNTWEINGKPIVIKRGYIMNIVSPKEKGVIRIGNNFKCNNNIRSNSIGLIQPCVFNVATPGSIIEIGNDVGISGSTINSTLKVCIGNNVLIGSGCLITDSDSHPTNPQERLKNCNNPEETISAPIHIQNNVFIGARTIILKGVTIGENSVIGAGSVVVKNIPANCIAAGNPAKVIKVLNQ